MQTTKKAHINKDQVDMEQHIQEAYTSEQKTIIKKDASMKFCNERDQLYLETYMSGFRLRGHLNVRDRMLFQKDDAPYYSVLQPIVFTS